jgi:hypothetical protein
MTSHESFNNFANRIMQGNNLLIGTPSRLDTAALRQKLEFNMSTTPTVKNVMDVTRLYCTSFFCKSRIEVRPSSQRQRRHNDKATNYNGERE